jgi:hypothetical protein
LHLYALAQTPLSPFLAEAQYRTVLDDCGLLGAALETEPQHWTARQVRAMVLQPQRLGAERYFTHWWQAADEVKTRTVGVMRQLFAAVAAGDLATTLGVNPAHGTLWNSLAHTSGDETPLPHAFEAWVLERNAEAERARRRAAPPAGYAGPVSGLQAGDRVQHPTSKLKGTVKHIEWVRGVEEAIVAVDGGGNVRYQLDKAKFRLIERQAPS